MKVTEYILKYISMEGVKHAFVVTGGAVVPLIDAFDKERNLEFICTTQEQGAAMAAEAYSRVTENLGVAIATSGPGATNLITGIGCAYFDSIPTLFITGQVRRDQLKKNSGVRQIGFQETDITKMIRPITKYSKLIEDSNQIKYELQKAVYIAKSGRPGPVLLDIPVDIQLSGNIEPDTARNYVPRKVKTNYVLLQKQIGETIQLINQAERPILILGGGVKLGKAKGETKSLVERLGIPTVLTWGAADLLPYNHPLLVGGFGVSPNGRFGNFAVQNSDLIISLGARLDTREIGGNGKDFAREAKKVVLDIDSKELNKWTNLYCSKGMNVDIGINASITDFILSFYENFSEIKLKDLSKWKKRISSWKEKYPLLLPKYLKQKDKVNPYVFIDFLSNKSKEEDIIITDAGGNLTWTMQSWKVKKNQKLFSAFGNSPMAYSLPASIGAYYASKKQIICIIGDGGLKMNINELETIVKHNLPVKIFLMNNHEFGIIKQFQDILCDSRYNASCPEGGLGDPDLIAIAKAYGMHTSQINNHKELKKIRGILNYQGPVLCSVELKHGEQISPKLKYGHPLEDLEPLLERKEFYSNMIIQPIS